ncbi:MAG TPA: LytTR family DNA-binding domain-containing protein [Longimicrobium sp.]|nr:LytTR family DNA-binding domain-containing protein [Longimicrobium sp.]
MKATLRTLIVDDEALARERLATLLRPHADVRVVGECAGGDEAVETIVADPPDLVFLDVQMPGRGGFDVVSGVGPERMPAVVFATAYDEFAVRAFDAAAVDYLLKPIGPERLGEALRRVRGRLSAGAGPADAPGLAAVLEKLGAPAAYRDRFAVRAGGRFHLVRAADVVWVEAADNYVRLHAPGGPHLLRETLREVERMLDPRRFLRIHRSMIVNIDRLQSLAPWGLGEYLFEMSDGTKLSSSRRYRSAIRDALGC